MLLTMLIVAVFALDESGPVAGNHVAELFAKLCTDPNAVPVFPDISDEKAAEFLAASTLVRRPTRLEEEEKLANSQNTARQTREAAARKVEQEAKAQMERIEAARLETERKAQEEAARLETERKAQEEAARLETKRKAQEEAARLETERKAQEEAARIAETERKAQEEAARLETERKAQEEAAVRKAQGIAVRRVKKAAERNDSALSVPQFKTTEKQTFSRAPRGLDAPLP